MRIKLTIDCSTAEDANGIMQINNLYRDKNELIINIGDHQFMTSVKDIITEDLPIGRRLPKTGSIIAASFVIEGIDIKNIEENREVTNV